MSRHADSIRRDVLRPQGLPGDPRVERRYDTRPRLSGAKDRGVVDYADKHDLILVTQDQKPAELADLMDVRNIYMSNALVARAVDREIREKYPDIIGV